MLLLMDLFAPFAGVPSNKSLKIPAPQKMGQLVRVFRKRFPLTEESNSERRRENLYALIWERVWGGVAGLAGAAEAEGTGGSRGRGEQKGGGGGGYQTPTRLGRVPAPAVTDADGLVHTIPFLTPGTYDVRAPSFQGFKAFEQKR